MTDHTIEPKGRLSNEIRALVDQIDRGADLALGTTLGELQRTVGKWLHELTLDELQAAHDDLSKRRDELAASLRDAGMSIPDIADKLGNLKLGTVYRALGVDPPTEGYL